MLTVVGQILAFFFKIVRLFSQKRDTYDVIAIIQITRISNTVINLKDRLRADVLAYSLWILHRGNEISFSFIVFDHCYFWGMNWKQSKSRFRGYYMEFFNIIFLTPGFRPYLDKQLSENGLKGKQFWKSEKGIRLRWILITATIFEKHCEIWNKSWVEELKLFDSYMSLIHAINTYLPPLLCFSSVMATFEIFHWQKFGIPNFGVSTTNLNPIDIFRRWWKLNFRLLGQVKLSHFFWKNRSKEAIFYMLYIFFGLIGWKWHWATLLDTDLDTC